MSSPQSEVRGLSTFKIVVITYANIFISLIEDIGSPNLVRPFVSLLGTRGVKIFNNGVQCLRQSLVGKAGSEFMFNGVLYNDCIARCLPDSFHTISDLVLCSSLKALVKNCR
jgi:hypothetical protein